MSHQSKPLPRFLLCSYAHLGGTGGGSRSARKYRIVVAVRGLLLLLLLCITAESRVVFAQSDLVLSQYGRVHSYYNSAYVGSRSEVYLTALHNRQWEGFEGASKSFVVMADMPLAFMGREHGVGIVISNDRIGLFTNSEIALQYAYRQKLLGGHLSIGLEGAFYNMTFDGTKVKLIDGEDQDVNDPAIPTTSVGGKTFDARVGLLYTHPSWYAGFSVRHLFAPKIMMAERYSSTFARSYFVVAGYNIKPKSSLVRWHPSIFASYDGYSYRADATAAMSYNDKFFASVMYRVNAAAGLSFGMKFGSFYAGYAFEMPTSLLASRNFGSHELLVSYSFPIKTEKKGNVRYKSVRLL